MDVEYVLAVDQQLSIECHLRFEWQDGVYKRAVNLWVGAQVVCTGCDDAIPALVSKVVGVAVIQEAEDEAATLATRELARLVGLALDRIEGEENTATLHGLNIQQA